MYKKEKSKNTPQDVPFSKARIPLTEETMLQFFQDLQNSMQSIYSIEQRREYAFAEMARRCREASVNIDWESGDKEFLPPTSSKLGISMPLSILFTMRDCLLRGFLALKL